jgi:hypothetical protein
MLFVTVVAAIGMEGLMSLLDYSGAFGATSHKFIDTVLGKAGARPGSSAHCIARSEQ